MAGIPVIAVGLNGYALHVFSDCQVAGGDRSSFSVSRIDYRRIDRIGARCCP
jgi:hypothetical protein